MNNILHNTSTIRPAAASASASTHAQTGAIETLAAIHTRTGGIDALAVRIPATVRYSEAFHQLRMSVLQKKGIARPDPHYHWRFDLRQFGINAILHENLRFGPIKAHKLELLKVGDMSAGEIRAEIVGVFDTDPDTLTLMRVDLYADVEGIPVEWFRTHAYVERKRSLQTHEIAEVNQALHQAELKNGVKTITFGSGANLLRIYHKSELWRQEHRRAVKLAKASNLEGPSFTETFGYGEDAVVTRIERQLRGRVIPPELSTVGLLFDNAPVFDPFASLVLLPGASCAPDPEAYSLSHYLRGTGARYLIEKNGLAEFRMFVNRRSKNNAAKVMQRILAFLPSDSEALAAPNVTVLYQNGVREQLAFVKSAASAD